MAAEGDTKPKELNLQPSESLSASGHTKCQDGNNGLVVDSPEETFSPTSVIFFKEALNSCNLSFGGSVSPTPVRQYEFHIERKKSKNPKDPIAIERLNLMNMAKLSIKGLIESALNLGRTLDSDYAPLQQFFVVMEHCLKHGLKTKKTFLGQNKSFWGALELVEKLTPEAGEITASVKDLPGLKTPLGRGRAWLRLALMQKKLSDYMKTIINRKDLLSEFYEANALMMEEEGAVIAGLLVGLNVIDANLCMKGEDLDSQVGVIDFSMYLKDSGNSSKSTEGDGQITAILDQKNYVEELNRHLSASVNNLQAKVDVLEKSNTKLTEELAVANNRIITLQEDVERVKEESSYQMESNRKALRSDAAVPVATDGQSLGETRKQLKEETLLRLDVEKELEVQIGMKQEMELSMKMLEKDVCEKQDALVELRTQMEDIRTFNQQLTHKAQSSEASSKQKGDIITGLEDKINQMAGTVKQLESRYKLDLELRRERARKSDQPFGTQPTVPSVPQKGRPHTEQAVTRHSLKVNVPDSEKAQEDASEDKTAEGSPTPSSECEDVKEKSVLELSQLSICTICEQEESLTRIKKRCKNCSGVFCESCLTNELPLPSSILPENVCDTCYFLLLQQYASSPT
uniref:Protein RUFY3 n=1 Tax=Gadus morhua TaxID=8049 RepID=A0A8C5FNZ7_GADMO